MNQNNLLQIIPFDPPIDKDNKIPEIPEISPLNNSIFNII